MTSHRTITAVLSTRNRPGDVRRGLPPLIATDADEIVVVDQSTDDATEAVVGEIAARAIEDGRVHYVRSDLTGASCARNVGLRRATSDLVAFTDDDCVVPPDWTSSMRDVMLTGGYQVVFGPVLAPADHDDAAMWIPEYAPVTYGPVGRDPDPISAFGFSANLGLERRIVATTGYFDELLGAGSPLIAAGEDTDFGYRAHRAGWNVGIVPAPIVLHYGARSGEERDRLRGNYQRGAGAMLDKHRRLGDRAARRRELIGIRDPLREALSNVVRLRKPSGLGVARSFVGGAVEARRHFDVDPVGKIYVRKVSR